MLQTTPLTQSRSEKPPFPQATAAPRAKRWAARAFGEQCCSLEGWRHRGPRCAAPGQAGDKATATGTPGGGWSSKPSSPGANPPSFFSPGGEISLVKIAAGLKPHPRKTSLAPLG